VRRVKAVNPAAESHARMLVRLADDGNPIRMGELLDFVSGPDCGGMVSFSGVVRGTEQGKPIAGIHYEHHPQMALTEMTRVVERALEAFEVSRVACVHRVGLVPVGEASVVILAAAPHRASAFDACEFVIDLLKQTVPIWKNIMHPVAVVDGNSVGER